MHSSLALPGPLASCNSLDLSAGKGRWRLLSLTLLALMPLFQLAPLPAKACVGPPPEPFCTKTLQLALAGPPVVLLPAGGVFDVRALVYFGLLDFPAGSGICPASPFTVDVSVTATCSPSGADGAGSVLGASLASGFNELTVPVTVPAGPPRLCTLSALATVTLSDGMVLTDTADNLACLGDPAPGQPAEPRLDLRLAGLPAEEIVRTHPGDPASFVYEIVNNDPVESFTGTLSVDSANESRMPGMSGPMPPGTGAVSVSDPVEGDNFPIELLEGDFASVVGEPVVEGCIALPADPPNPVVPTEILNLVLAPGESAFVTIRSRHWGMCADGSCGRSTLELRGIFSDTSSGVACSGFVTAADTSMPPSYGCDDSGETARFPPPPDPLKLRLTAAPMPGTGVDLDAEVTQATLLVNGIPGPAPIPFSGTFTDDRGRIQLQFVDTFAVDSFFDIGVSLRLQTPTGSDFESQLLPDALEGAPTGFERTAPFVAPVSRIRDLVSGQTVGFFQTGIQASAVGIDNLGERRQVSFSSIQFLVLGGGDGVDVVLGGGEVAPGGGIGLEALEVSFDLRGFLAPEAQGQVIFEDGFESGNVSRWSRSEP
ncbi:MAG: hypothetical protein KDD47_08595 [Acidobacteria bacterium]|nr:hypothetical protein [Acidobacteriota bacterium]